MDKSPADLLKEHSVAFLSSYAPPPADLASIKSLLASSTSGDSSVHSSIIHSLNSLASNQNFPIYLSFIFANASDPIPVRTVAGLTLKNFIRDNKHLQPSIIDYIKATSIISLADNHSIIRSTAGTIITTINSSNPSIWPDLILNLIALSTDQNINLVEGVFDALRKICEDSANSLNSDNPVVLDSLINTLLNHFHHQNPKIRVFAIEAVNQFILLQSEPLFARIQPFVSSIYQLTSDENKPVRKAICQSIVFLFEVAPESLIPELNNVVAFMLFCTQDQDKKVALEACEFWLAFAEQNALRDYLDPFIPRIIPVLLNAMVYTDEEIAILGGDEDDTAVPDSAQDIKPRHHKSRVHPSASSSQPTKQSGDQDDHDDDDDASEDNFDDDDDMLDTEWSLRKCAAAALDVMATVFQSSLLNDLLPHINTQLFHSNWTHREAAILALGAIAEGCLAGMSPHLSQLVPHLLNFLVDPKPLVRSITCWTLGRYAEWILRGDSSPTPIQPSHHQHHLQTYFEPVLQSVLRSMLDNNKRVQETACSALAVLEETGGPLLIPYLHPIMTTIVMAFPKYQRKNMLILYDAIGTLSDAVGHGLNRPELIDMVMPVLMTRWSSLDDMDHDVFPVVECLSSVAIAVGHGFMPYAEPVWIRCMRIITNCLQQYTHHVTDPSQYDEPDKDFIVVSLDLVSAVIQAIGGHATMLMQTGSPCMVDLVLMCMKSPYTEVRQSSCACIGDFAIHVYPTISTSVPDIMSLMVPMIHTQCGDDLTTAITNNAIWATGELAMKLDRGMDPYIHHLSDLLTRILITPSTKPTIKENAAICIGRLCITYPHIFAPMLDTIMVPFMMIVMKVRMTPETRDAITGFLLVVVCNPNGGVGNVALFCEAVVRWGDGLRQMDHDGGHGERNDGGIEEKMGELVRMYANGMGDQWNTVMANVGADIRTRLRERYGV